MTRDLRCQKMKQATVYRVSVNNAGRMSCTGFFYITGAWLNSYFYFPELLKIWAIGESSDKISVLLSPVSEALAASRLRTNA